MADRVAGVRRGAAFYKELVERRAREGLTWAEAARAGGTSLSTLHRWSQRLPGAPTPAFIELGPAAQTRAQVEIVLAGGRVLRVPHGPPPEGLVELVHLLERTC